MIKIFVFYVLIIFTFPRYCSCQSEKILDFAKFLFQMEEYEKAETEYLRYLFRAENTRKYGEAYYWLGKSNQGKQDWEKSIYYFRKSFDEYPTGIFSDDSIFEISCSFIELGFSEKARYYFNLLLEIYPESGFCDDSKFLIGVSYLGEYQWKLSEEVFDEFLLEYPESELFGLAKVIKRDTTIGQTLPRKSCVLAGCLSTVFPGAGHIYAGKKMDGLNAFLLNVILMGATAHSWQNENRTTAYFFGWLGMSFYLGNIYGGTNAAKRFNREQKEFHLRQIKDKIFHWQD